MLKNTKSHYSIPAVMIIALMLSMMLFLASAALMFSYAGIDGSGSSSDPYDISSGDLEIDADKGGEYWIEGSTEKHHIKIKKKDADEVEEIKLHLVDVKIELQKADRGDSKEDPCIRIEDNAKVTICIDKNSDTVLTGGNAHGAGRNSGHAAIAVAGTARLNLDIEGSLTATGGDGGSDRGAAAIGSGDTDNMGSDKCGALNIHVYDGASLKAVGAAGGAGIGGGNNSGTHDINITLDGSAGLEARGYEGGAGIGGGDDGSTESNIVIKGDGTNKSSLTASGESGGAGIGGGSDGSFSALSIDGIGTLKCTGGSHAAGIGGGDHDGTGSGGNFDSVSVTNCNVVEATGGDGGAGIGGGKDTDIYKGITVENCGTVTATGGKDAAGIGTGRDSTAGVNVNCGTVVVKNCKVTAVSPDGSGAGIGCGRSAHIDSITIDGSYDITATGHGEGSGIGYAGGSVDSGSGSVDKIKITNVKGKMIAKAGENGAGIGLGVASLDDNDPEMGSIVIVMNGGTIEATASGTNNAGIGGGKSFGGSEISKIDISGPGTITAKGTAGGSAIGSGDDSNVRNGISIIGPDNGRDLTVNVSCFNTDKDAASCPLIGIDDPDNDEGDATDIIIKNVVLNGEITRASGRNCPICIGGGQYDFNALNAGWINKIDIDNCNIKLKGDTGVGIGGNTRVSVGTINITNSEYDGMAIGSMGDPVTTLISGDVTTRMKKINIENSKVKAVAKMKKANDGYSNPMAGIGGGNKTYVEDITIDGSEVTASGVDGGAGIGGGGYRYDSSFLGDFFTVYGDMGDYFGDNISISNSTVDAKGSEGQIYEYMRTVIVINGEGDLEGYDYKTRAFTGCGAGIGGGGFQSFKNIDISDSEVTSMGAGTTNYGTWHLWEESIDSGAAGIGGGSMGTARTISIDGSKVSATGTFGGAGIGTGGKDYQIQQSLLKAFSGDFGLGDIDVISITDSSDVVAEGGFYGAGIGGGEKSRIHKINIEDSTVKSTGGEGGAGIGGGVNSVFAMATNTGSDGERVGIINIADSDVTATGGSGGAGIGTGVSLKKHSEENGARSIEMVRITGSSKVTANGGEGGAGIGGAACGNKHLEEFLHWDGSDEFAAGNVNQLQIAGGSSDSAPLVLASAGKNCISKEDSLAYKTAPVDIGLGGYFEAVDSSSLEQMDISAGSVYSKGDAGRYDNWTGSYRSGASVNAFAPDKDSKHLDSASGKSEVYLVKLRVPDVSEPAKVSITVDGDGSADKNGKLYYDNTTLYTDSDGMLYLWLREGGEDKTEADVNAGGTVYHYKGTSRTDHSGVLVLCASLELNDGLSKVYDGQPVDEPSLKECTGDGELSYIYYKGDLSDKTPEELKALTDEELKALSSEKLARDQVTEVGKYTVLVEMSAGEIYGSASGVGTYEIVPCDTTVSEAAASASESASGNVITLKATVAGLVSTDTDCGKVIFTVKQGDTKVGSYETTVGGDGAAEVSFTAGNAAGSYSITASFKCNEEKPNYYDSESDAAVYDLGKLDVSLLADPSVIRETYGCDPISIPQITASVEEQAGAIQAEDEKTVVDGLKYTLTEPASGAVVSFNQEGDKLLAEKAGVAVLKVTFDGNERLNAASVNIPVVISRMPLTAVPKVSVNSGGSWSGYSSEASTVYGRTAEGEYLKYRVDYYAGDALIDMDGQELAEALPLSSGIFASKDAYEVPLVRTAISANYNVTLGGPAKVLVNQADRELSCSCDDVVFGQTPAPAAVCSTPYDETELSYHYEGTTNSGEKYEGDSAPAKAGSYKVTASISEAPGQYNKSTSAADSFVISRADLENPTVTAEDHVYGDSLSTYIGGNTENGKVSYTFYRDEKCETPVTSEDGASESGGEPANVGEYYVVAHIAETADYNAADTEPDKFSITPRAAEVKADDKNKRYGESDPEFTASVSGLVGNDSLDYTIARIAGEESGTYEIIPAGEAVQGNYEVTYSNGLLTIGDKYELRFTLDGGSLNGMQGAYIMSDLKYGQTVIIPDAPVRYGYVFKYWKGSEYYPGDIYTVTGSHSFTAVWEAEDSSTDDDSDDADDDEDDDDDDDDSDSSGSSGKNSSNSKSTKSKSAKTGDSSDLTLWITAFLASVLMLTAVGIRRKN